jgi:sugar/nucleoside kinase (ribokinase family)
VPVIDTTGCGDAFSAALLVARLEGRDVATAARFANACAALVATGLGSDAGLVDRQQVEEFATTSPAAAVSELRT